jgi:hypothetical protein
LGLVFYEIVVHVLCFLTAKPTVSTVGSELLIIFTINIPTVETVGYG